MSKSRSLRGGRPVGGVTVFHNKLNEQVEPPKKLDLEEISSVEQPTQVEVREELRKPLAVFDEANALGRRTRAETLMVWDASDRPLELPLESAHPDLANQAVVSETEKPNEDPVGTPPSNVAEPERSTASHSQSASPRERKDTLDAARALRNPGMTGGPVTQPRELSITPNQPDTVTARHVPVVEPVDDDAAVAAERKRIHYRYNIRLAVVVVLGVCAVAGGVWWGITRHVAKSNASAVVPNDSGTIDVPVTIIPLPALSHD